MPLARRAEPLRSPARTPAPPAGPEALLARLVALGETRKPLTPTAKAEMEAALLALVAEAEPDVRARLAGRIARAWWTPPRLVGILAHDEIEVARPVIAANPLLDDDALIRLLGEASLAHRVEVARRPRLSARVARAVIAQGDPAVLTALAANRSADISPSGLARLVEHARTIAALGAPLAEHPRLSAELARALYLWVGLALRAQLAARFGIDQTVLEAVIAASMSEGLDRSIPRGPTPGETKLVEKLEGAGQLSAGYLVKVLKAHQLGLFEAALARLGRFHPCDVHRAVLHVSRPELLALACAAVGIDRSVFPTILATVRQCAGGLPGGGGEGGRRAMGAFGPFAPQIAASAFRLAVASV
ncbi:MAG TPA: DUF2336 domain-containing protein [Caulobacteraceae bacterium]